jgi:large subunit ribosomal protein L15
LAAKVFLSGGIEKKVKLVGIGATKGAKAAIEAAGGSVEVAPAA